MKIYTSITCFYLILFLGCSGGVHKNINSDNDSEPHKKALAVIDTFFYEPSVSIVSGAVFKELVYGEPGYGEDTNEDRKDSIYLIVLDKKIDVHARSNPDSNNKDDIDYDVDEFNVDTIQITFRELSYVKKYIRSRVRAKGTFFHGYNGHHYTKVLMDVNEVWLDSKNDSLR